MKDTIHTIRHSSRRFFSGTLLSRFSGMLRDISMAYVFGTQPSIAAFMVAFRLAHLLRRLFGEGAMQSSFIPEFEALRHQDERRAATFFRDLILLLTLFLIALITFSSAILSGFLFWGNLDPGTYEVVYFTLLMLPSLLFICLFGLNTSFLQCEKSYFVPGVAPVAFNLIWVAVVLSLRNTPVEDAMPWLCLGVVIACLAQWLLTVPQTWKKIKSLLQTPLLSSVTLSSSDLRRLGPPLALGILGVAASQINSAVDSLFARFAESEGPAFLWFAIRIQQLPLALFGIAVAGAVLPPLSRAVKAGNLLDYRHFLHDALSRTWMFMLPLTAALFAMGDTTVAFLYGRGDFSLASTVQTTHCLWAYAIGLVPSALVLILAPASYAQSNYTLPAIASFMTMFLNITLNTLCIIFLGWGAVSIALATSISAWVNFFYLARNLSKAGISALPYPSFTSSIPLITSTCLSFYGTYGMRILLQAEPFFSSNFLSLDIYKQIFLLFSQAATFFTLFFSSFLFLSLFFPATKKEVCTKLKI